MPPVACGNSSWCWGAPTGVRQGAGACGTLGPHVHGKHLGVGVPTALRLCVMCARAPGPGPGRQVMLFKSETARSRVPHVTMRDIKASALLGGQHWQPCLPARPGCGVCSLCSVWIAPPARCASIA